MSFEKLYETGTLSRGRGASQKHKGKKIDENGWIQTHERNGKKKVMNNRNKIFVFVSVKIEIETKIGTVSDENDVRKNKRMFYDRSSTSFFISICVQKYFPFILKFVYTIAIQYV